MPERDKKLVKCDYCGRSEEYTNMYWKKPKDLEDHTGHGLIDRFWGHCPWIYRLVGSDGFEVLTINPHRFEERFFRFGKTNKTILCYSRLRQIEEQISRPIEVKRKLEEERDIYE